MKISRAACAAIVLAWRAMTAPVGAVVDLDGGGVGDVWRLKFAAAGLAGNAGADGDGKSNADEARAGTDPKSPLETLRVNSVLRNGGTIEIRWGTVAGRRYKVQSAAEPGAAATWTDGTGFLDGSGAEMMQALPLPGGRTFYRVAVYEKDSASDGVDDWEELQRERIESDEELKVARMEIDEVIRTARWTATVQSLGKVAVRVDEPDAVAGGDVVHDEIAQQRRFSRTSLADEVEVMALVGRRNAEGDFVPQPCRLPKLEKCSFLVP